MPLFQFKPVNKPYIKHVVGDKYGSYISASIKCYNFQNGVALETGERLEELAGNLYLHRGFGEERQELKEEGYLGVLSYYKGVEDAGFHIYIYVSNEEFDNLAQLFSNNILSLVNIETPLGNKLLNYGLLPDDPMVWKVKEQPWIPLESCDFSFMLGGDVAL